MNALVRVLAAAALAVSCGGSDSVVGPPPTPVPTQLSLSIQPAATAPNAAPLPVQPAVRLRDANGIVVAKAGVAITVAATGSVTLANATATTDGTGTATFSALTLTGPVGSYTLTFSATGLTGVSSNAVALTPGAATQLAVTTQPSVTSAAGVALAVQPVVQLRDVSGNDATQSGVTVTAALVSGTPTVGNATAVSNAAGQASFAGLAISGAVGSYTLRFSAPGLTQADAAAATALTAGPATQVALATAPSATAVNGTVLAVQPVAQLRDAFGNNATQAGVVVVATVVTGPAGSAIAGDSATTAATGAATFSGLKLTGLVGSYGLRFAASGLTSVVGTTALTAGAATKLGLTTAPTSNPQSGVAFPTQPVVQVQDASGNAVAQAGAVVHATVSGVTLANDSATTDAAGKATFSGLTMTGTSAFYTLSFTTPGLTAATSALLALSPGPVAQLSLSTQPALTAVNAVVLSRQPVVRLTDGAGNVVFQSNVVVTATVVSGTVALASATATTNTSGVATFSGLTLTGVIGSYTLRFSAPSLASTDASAPTVLSAGAASQLGLTTQPATSAASGAVLSPQPVVQLRDVSGNAVAQAGVVVTATAAGVSVAGGTATTNGAGVATFTALTLSGPANAGYTLAFGATGVTGVSATVATALSPGAPATITLVTAPPLNAVNNVALSITPQVLLADAAGNGIPSSQVRAEAPGATVVNGLVTTNGAGIASFPGLILTGQVAGYSLRFCAGNDCNLTLVVVASPTPTALATGAAALLTVTAQPSTAAQSGVIFAGQPAVHVTDVAGNPIAGATVTATAGAASVAGATALTDGLGNATFGGMALSGAVGNYTLHFATGSAAANAAAATVLTPGPTAAITINTQPSAAATNGVVLAQQPVVTVSDAAGNGVAGVTVTASTTAGVTVNNPTATTNGSGVATFANLALTGTAGGYTLTFASGVVTQNANATTLTAGAPLFITITTQPPATPASGVPFATAPVVHVSDGVNPVAGVAVTATVAGATLSNATAITNGAGNATFTGLTLTGIAPASYTINFSAGAVPPTPANAVNLQLGTGSNLAVVTPPSVTAQNGVSLATQPTVQITDAGGNSIAQQNVTITATLVSGTAVVGSATALTSASGLATFSGLKLTGTVGSYTFRFSGPALAGVNAAAPTVLSAGPAAKLGVTTQPAFSAIVGQLLTRQPVVQLQDQSGNPVAQAGVSVTVTSDSLPATLQGTLSGVTTGAGSLAYTDLLVNATAGHRLLRFTSGGLTAAAASDTMVVAAPLTSGTPVVSGGSFDVENPYAITVPAGKDSLVVTISDPTLTQTADLYVRFGAAPDPSGGPAGTGLYDCYPGISGANETCKMVLPAAGTWYVLVRAFPFGYTNVTLTARVY